MWLANRLPHELFGIVDAVRIRHTKIVGTEYDKVSEQLRLDVLLDKYSLKTLLISAGRISAGTAGAVTTTSRQATPMPYRLSHKLPRRLHQVGRDSLP